MFWQQNLQINENERGFFLPMVLVMVLIVFTILGFAIQHLWRAKSKERLEQERWQVHYALESAIAFIQRSVKEEEILQSPVEIQVNQIPVTITFVEMTDQTVTVLARARIPSGVQKSVQAEIDRATLEIVAWQE